jgi:rSAM/selenodomain-associated transferase 2/rSAM/selenodomain-associated transferase 1
MSEEPLVSVVIPVWRDENALATVLETLHSTSNAETIVASVLGEDSRRQSTHKQQTAIRWISAPRGRACQMNAGASVARGRWLLFLHADSRLPTEWLEVIAHADGCPDIAAGSFRLTLNSRDWRARVIEVGVRLRVALFGLPYGDQALFVRRQVFDNIGGYRDLPLMEDIDLMRRLRTAGRLHHSRAAVITGASRWERDGWVRRSAQNVFLATRFLLGASPAQLAQAYFNRKARAVVMMARAPWTAGKMRLGVRGDQQAHAELRRALFLDTLDVVTAISDADHLVACQPPEACQRMREFVRPGIDVIAQRGSDLGARLRHVFEDVFRLGAESVVVIGSDLPDLPQRLLRDAFARLHGGSNRVVLGPATDGGYYLIGMNRPNPALFDGVEWSTPGVLAQTLDAAKAQDLEIVMLDRWTDVDDAADLDRLTNESAAYGATRTRAWASQSTDTSST